ncbi:PilZ domain-containing protein [Novosphingobium sp.]|uniref:PilZ domain-containing protein n=1 Tax=Novosphingobium sp. TaxID=1874826 RepID=UPI0035B20CD6
MQPRQETRSPILWRVQVRAENGLRSFGHMIDLSAGGCCIEAEDKPPRIKSRILVRPDGLDGFAAQVQWVRGRQFGAAFDRPIYGPVLDHFVRKHAALAPYVSLGALG